MADLFYYESGYLDDNYFVYTADAGSAMSADSQLTASATTVIEFTANLVQEVYTNATISHQQGADIFAFSQALLDIQVSLIQNNNIAASASFDLAVDGVRGIYVSAQADADSVVEISFGRLRDHQAAVDAAFSLSADVTLIRAAVEAQADLTTDSTLTASGGFSIVGNAALASTSSISASPVKTATDAPNLVTDVSLTTSATKTTDSTASLEVNSVTTADYTRIQSTSANCSANFTPAVNALAIINSFALLEQDSQLTATAENIAGLSASLVSDQTLDVSANRTRATSVTIDADFVVSAVFDGLLVDRSAELTTNSTLTASIGIVKDAEAVIEVQTSTTALANMTASAELGASSDASLTTSIALEFHASADIQVNAFELAAAAKTGNTLVTIEANSSLSCQALRIRNAVVGNAISGVVISPTGETNWFPIVEFPSTVRPNDTDGFLVSFWAQDPSGTLLTTQADGYQDQGGKISFQSGSIVFDGFYADYVDPGSYKRTTWNVTTSGWNHYIIYQQNQTQVATLFINGDEVTDRTFVNYKTYPYQPEAGNDLALYAQTQTYITGNLVWMLGANGYRLGPYSSEFNTATKRYIPAGSKFEGSLGQFAVWWSNIPDASEADIRDRLYLKGPINLGSTGTDTGLAQPNIYLRLEDYTDYQQRGSASLNRGQDTNSIYPGWAHVTGTTVIAQETYNTWDFYSATSANNADGIIPGITAVARLTATAEAGLFTTAALASQAALAAQATRVLQNPASLSSTSQLTASVTRIQPASASLEVNAFELVATSVSALTSANLSSQFTLTVQASSEILTNANLQADTQVQANAILTAQGSASISADLALTASVDKFAGFSSGLASQTTLQANASSIIDASANIQVNAFELVIGVILGQDGADLAANSSLEATPNKITGISADLSAVISCSSSGDRVVGAEAALQALAFELVSGTKIQIDPYLMLLIVPEQRSQQIRQETRSLIVVPEQRSYAIKQETRGLLIVDEDRVNITEG